MPLVKPAHVFGREKEIAVGRAVAETRAEVQAELNSLWEEVQTLREQNLELTGLARGKCHSPTAFWCSSSSCLDVIFVCIAQEHSMSQSETKLKKLRVELRATKESIVDVQADLELANKNSDQACVELNSARELLSQAQEELESLGRELKKSWELEAESQNCIKQGKEELESTPLIPSCPFVLFFLPE